MPKCQFLFSAVFGFRNPSNEIFSESDEINAKVPILPGSLQNTREPPEMGQGGPTPHLGAGQGLAAPPGGEGTLVTPLRRLSAYKEPLDQKTRYQLTKPTEPCQSRRQREAKIWGTGSLFRHPAGAGKCPRKASPSTPLPSPPPSSSPLLLP